MISMKGKMEDTSGNLSDEQQDEVNSKSYTMRAARPMISRK